jgi:hypothetical protein
LAKADGSVTGLTQQDVLTACSPESTPSPSPAPNTASCSNIQAYDTNWNLLSASQLSALKKGDKVNFTVHGTTTTSFDKARFTINGTALGEVTTQKPGSSQEFYTQYTIPAGTTSFTIKGEIHDSGTNGWY